jgi:transcriptional regulator with XRE-family HTH domain
MTMTPVGTAKTLTQLVALEIRLEMVRQDMLQSQLARKLGKTEQWLSVRLRGRQPIDLNDLALIARGLDVSVHKLLPNAPYAVAGVTVLEPKVTKRVTQKRAARPGHRPNGRPNGGVAPGNRRTVRTTRSGPAKRH